MNEVKIYSDGSAVPSKSGWSGGWAFVIVGEKSDIYGSGGQQDTTNNQMEIIAVIEAIRYCKDHLKFRRLIIHTDSNLVYYQAQKLWKRNANLDLWQEFDILSEDVQIEWIKVKAHSGNFYNEKVNKLANSSVVI